MCSFSGTASTSDECVGFDLHHHARVEQGADLEHGGDGTDVGEDLAVGAPDDLPLRDVGDEHARAHDVLQARADLRERRLDVGERLLGLDVGVAGAGDGAVLRRRRAAGDPHMRSGAHHPAVADDRLPLDARSVALDRQWRKWRWPVTTIVTPAASAAAMTSSSRLEPPGCTIAFTPASIASAGPSAKGKKASEAIAAPLRSSSGDFSTARRTASTRLICPAPMPTVALSRARTIALDFTWRHTCHAKSRSRHSSSVGGRPVTTSMPVRSASP